MQTNPKALQDYSEMRSVGDALAGLDRLLRVDWPRYLRQLPEQAGETPRAIATSLAGLAAIDKKTDFELLIFRLRLIVKSLPPLPAATGRADKSVERRLQRALHNRIQTIEGLIGWGSLEGQGSYPLSFINLVATETFRTAELLAAWGVSRPSGTRVPLRKGGPIPPLVVHS